MAPWTYFLGFARLAPVQCVTGGHPITTGIPTISHRRTLDEAFRLLQEKSVPAVGVVDATGRLVGMITSETIGEMLMVRDALPPGVRFGPWSRPAGA